MNNKDYLNSSVSKPSPELLGTFLFENKSNPKITPKKEVEGHCLVDVRRIALLKFGTYPKMGKAMGFGSKRAWHILHGINLPKSPDIIRRVADALNIDPLILTQIFEEERRNNENY